MLSTLSFSQGISVKATRQHWSGGTCCSSGTNYKVTIYGHKDSLDKIVLKYVMLDGNEFIINKVSNSNSEYAFLQFEFGVSNNYQKDEIQIEKIEVVDHTKINENYILITFNQQEMKIPLTEIDDLFYLAYP